MTFTQKVLDHGYVTLHNLAGPVRRAFKAPSSGWPGATLGRQEERPFDADDTDIAHAARMSFDNEDDLRTYEAEMKLTAYLMKNHHDTPFEVIIVWLEYKLPIFVARQFHRHRTQAINEISGRYVTLPAEWYVPELKDVVLQSTDKKQGGMLIDLDNEDQVGRAQRYLDRLQGDCHHSYCSYEASIADGIAMEQARLHLHVNHYTRYMSTVNLRNLLGFLLLRDHKHAQREAQMYAKAVCSLLKPHIPGIMDLYETFKKVDV